MAVIQAFALALAFQTSPPNVVVILSDDVGYADISFNGGGSLATPNIDRIAAGGVKFTDAYVTAPLCAPSRCGLLTGKYPESFGFQDNPDLDDPNWRNVSNLPLDQLTLAERLKAAGYATGMVGKWHLGYTDGYLPNDRGFDSFFGFLEHANTYLASDTPMFPFWDNKTATTLSQYETREFGQRASDFIDSHAAAPFFLYVPFGAAHTPLEATYALKQRFPTYTGKLQAYCAVISAMDDAVGVILNAIQRNHLKQNTLVVFLNDNGGRTDLVATNTPLRGTKAGFFEGGIRVPFAMMWPAKINAGTVDHRMISSMDVVPTVMAGAGRAIPDGLNGVNLLPYLKKVGPKTTNPHGILFWWNHNAPGWAVRYGNYKYVNTKDTDGSTVEALYDLSTDVGETTDLKGSQPAVAGDLVNRWRHWKSTLPPPMW
jgi:arylsulfatase A-like enzyme